VIPTFPNWLPAVSTTRNVSLRRPKLLGSKLTYRVLQEMGVTLVGHFRGAEDGRVHFASDLSGVGGLGDARYRDTRTSIIKLCSRRDIPVPDMPDPAPFDARAPQSVDLAGPGL